MNAVTSELLIVKRIANSPLRLSKAPLLSGWGHFFELIKASKAPTAEKLYNVFLTCAASGYLTFARFRRIGRYLTYIDHRELFLTAATATPTVAEPIPLLEPQQDSATPASPKQQRHSQAKAKPGAEHER